LSKIFTSLDKVNTVVTNYPLDKYDLIKTGICGAYLTVFNTHSSKDGWFATGLAPSVLAYSPEIAKKDWDPEGFQPFLRSD
jgi:hypothetical protein